MTNSLNDVEIFNCVDFLIDIDFLNVINFLSVINCLIYKLNKNHYGLKYPWIDCYSLTFKEISLFAVSRHDVFVF